MQNSDCILIQGSNFAECHPVGFQWVMEAKRRGATIIHVDPRFTRTSAMADVHAPIRPGTDIAFLGGLIHYILENERYFRDYLLHYTNAAVIVDDGFQDTEDLQGLFSGWNTEGGKAHYDFRTWQYQGVGTVPAAGHKEIYGQALASTGPGGQDIGNIQRDETLASPRCVFRILERHFARYTPEMVEKTCGLSKDLFLKIAEKLCESSGPDRTSALCYSVGWTQHAVGVQIIRAASIVQLLLGNIGRPGGGILALRGHASIQGSTDIPTLFNLLPGYVPMPHAMEAQSLEGYLKTTSSASGWWSEMPKYVVSLLKAWYGQAARADNEWAFAHLPRLTGNHSHLTTIADMAEGRVKGYFVMGENPVVGSTHGALQRKAMRRAEWVVVRDFVLTETAEFWRKGAEYERGELRPEEVQTEVFFFPAAAHSEKDGSFTNAHRLVQWHHKAIEPPGEARSELHFLFHLGRRLKQLYAGSSDPKDRPLLALTWDYPTEGPYDEPSAESIVREINGYTIADGKPVSGYTKLQADGSTASGCWLYSGCYADGVNQLARRKPHWEQSHVAPEWAWAWPDNRRILYNRASADPQGRPWSERKRYVWWDSEKGEWVGKDKPDFIQGRPPSYRPQKEATGLATIAGDDPFIMQADGKGWLYAPSGLLDGPLPTHYEPQESPVANPLYPQQCNPARVEWRRKDNPYHWAFDDPRFPHVLTTYRIAEHHTAGGMSRWQSWLSELSPEMFCEVSAELAAFVGLRNGGWATVRTARGEIEARVLVTERLRPFKLDGRLVHSVGLPYHWGGAGRVRGDAANELLGFVADPNVNIFESKALTCSILPGRLSRGRRAATGRVVGEYAAPPGVQRDLEGVGQLADEPSQKKERWS